MDNLHFESNVGVSSKLNWLRAAVLGAQDGVVSVSSIIVGVAGASDSRAFILTAGVAGLVAGALSMAAGEYVSVSTQRDTERALLEKERRELETQPEEELEELAHIYESKGLSRETALKVAEELTAHDAFAAHVEAELKIDQHELANPLHAGVASAGAFFVGAIIPLAIVMLAPAGYRIPVMLAAVFFVLIVTGFLSAYAGGANKFKAIARVLAGGTVAMVITFAAGKFLGGLGI
ncbi:VIT family protein [Patescibacteria group bacterium]|nr:VIT family protein [Patescibacteria group bacterium]